MYEEQVHHKEIKEVEYRKTDWLIFLVAFAALMTLLLCWGSRFFWVALPLTATYLVKSLKMM